MTEGIIVSIITGALTLLGTIITVIATNSRTRADIKTTIAVQDERQKQMNKKIDELAAEVRSHNEYGRRIPVLEEKIKVMNHRIEDLERGKGA